MAAEAVQQLEAEKEDLVRMLNLSQQDAEAAHAQLDEMINREQLAKQEVALAEQRAADAENLARAEMAVIVQEAEEARAQLDARTREVTPCGILDLQRLWMVYAVTGRKTSAGSVKAQAREC